MSYLENKEIQTLIHYPIPTHKQKAFENGKYTNLSFTEQLADRIISLPFNVAMTDKEQLEIISNIKTFFN